MMLLMKTRYKSVAPVKPIHTAGIALLTLSLAGCVSLLPPTNQPITQINPDKGYRIISKDRKPVGDHHILLAFSGGGTRAAALSYGVLQELRDTHISTGDSKARLLDEVDVISSVSGGSFTAAYYGLYGDAIFKNYESDFLRQSVQSALVKKLLNPGYWFRAAFSGINRTDMAVSHYDKTVFHGATFADIPLDKRPFIEINATDLSTGAHIAFTQGYFDMFCTDLSSYPVARAVTASSGVPIMFPPVTIKNHSDQCDIMQSPLGSPLQKKSYDNAREAALINAVLSYQDTKKHPYIHMVDGGVSDNLGLRAALERTEVRDIDPEVWIKLNPVKTVMVILVNAEVKPVNPIDQSYQAPSVTQTAGALSGALISRYTVETRALARSQMQAYEEQLRKAGINVRFHFIEVDFSALESPSLQTYFNKLPTTLELSNEEVDNLIAAGRRVLRQSAAYQDFLALNGGNLQETEQSTRPCTLFQPLNCLPLNSTVPSKGVSP